MTEKDVVVRNRAGIHARPAAMIVQAAARFSSHIEFATEHETINAKSIMGIITLGAGYQAMIRIKADGDDEEEAVEQLVQLFESGFEE
ncbi:phosphocarrier protein [Alkalispirochaeta americana]|uniref:Phosphocarrier protein n=1 Tax=Alkalispirochaeta americana TaxID=159291 RepID=A0A1N6U1T2_9SPIO|nr:HPr family phosphocarrier protein [Alkalispirochaeta americana]SIQ59540.1 phosphocarrier protein [Alkalispirochaeta americana]